MVWQQLFGQNKAAYYHRLRSSPPVLGALAVVLIAL
tara:strand:+ start:1676 stop:1783 length:108 start_codon:yes stop_codon:yes gene_type:complete